MSQQGYDLDSGVLMIRVYAYAADRTGYYDVVNIYAVSPVSKLYFASKKYEIDQSDKEMCLKLYSDRWVMFEVSSANSSIGGIRINYEETVQDPESGLYEYNVYFKNSNHKKGSVMLSVKALDGSKKTAVTKVVVK